MLAVPIDPNLMKVLSHVLHFPEKKMKRVVELVRTYRFSTDSAVQQEILTVLAELLTQDVVLNKALTDLNLDDTVDVESARKVASYRRGVGANIRTFRQECGLTQVQLAEKAGLPQSHISRLEKGVHAATAETIRRIAVALNKEMGEIDPAY
jgi:predicted transcriptional regulator